MLEDLIAREMMAERISAARQRRLARRIRRVNKRRFGDTLDN